MNQPTTPAQHTPTPWSVEEGTTLVLMLDANKDAVATARDRKSAERIKTAVNHHAELLACAQWQVDALDLQPLEFFQRHGFSYSESVDRTRALLAKLEGTPV